MPLTVEEVRKVAALARLRLSVEEVARFVGQLGKVVDYIDQLQSLDAPPAGIPDLAAPEAADRPQPCLPRERFLANTPAAMDGFLLVPEVKGGSEDG
jgi:aspartyl-tRNA(Asn)/glutamyl-tRNA(Gln) amidotransferase subunit C